MNGVYRKHHYRSGPCPVESTPNYSSYSQVDMHCRSCSSCQIFGRSACHVLVVGQGLSGTLTSAGFGMLAFGRKKWPCRLLDCSRTTRRVDVVVEKPGRVCPDVFDQIRQSYQAWNSNETGSVTANQMLSHGFAMDELSHRSVLRLA